MARKSAGRSSAIVAPAPPSTRLRLDALPDGDPCADCRYADLTLVRAALGDQVAPDASFGRVWFERVRLDATRMPGLHIRDARFDGCDLAGADWQKAHLSAVEFVECRLLGIKLVEARIRDAIFSGCAASLGTFFAARFVAVRFTGCDLTEASFQEADLAGVIFERCDLRGANFHGASLVGADLRGSRLDGVRVGGTELRGAIVEPTQAALLAEVLGLVVRWEG